METDYGQTAGSFQAKLNSRGEREERRAADSINETERDIKKTNDHKQSSRKKL